MGHASWIYFGTIVTCLAWIVHRLVKIGLVCLLQSTNGYTLEVQVYFEVLTNFLHQTLKGEFVSQKFSGLLMASDFRECRSARPVTMRFLHHSSRGRTLESRFCSQSFSGCFTTVMGLWAVCFVQASHGISPSAYLFPFSWVREPWQHGEGGEYPQILFLKAASDFLFLGSNCLFLKKIILCDYDTAYKN